MSKLVDPFRIFDQFGLSIATRQHLEDRVDQLEKENEVLKRRLVSQARRRKYTEDEPEPTSVH